MQVNLSSVTMKSILAEMEDMKMKKETPMKS